MTLSKTHTLDGVKVEEGLMVWDYDLCRREVGPIAFVDHGDPWYFMKDPATGRYGSDMNPSRMWRRHPSTGEEA